MLPERAIPWHAVMAARRALAVALGLAMCIAVMPRAASAAESDSIPEWRLTPSIVDTDDVFGQKVATDGGQIIVGAPGSAAVYDRAGTAYVFTRDGDGWSESAVLSPADGVGRSFFGSAVAIDDDLAVVGAYGHRGAGATYVFERTDASWDNTHVIRRARSARGEEFGYAVAISEGGIVIGAPSVSEAGLGAGAVFVYERDAAADGGWREAAMLTAADAMTGDSFGLSVGTAGEWLAVGAPGRLDSKLGYVYLFERTPAGWVQRQRLIPSLGGSGVRRFGASLAMDDERVFVGAYVLAGGAYMFRREGRDWTEEFRTFGSDTDTTAYFAQSVALSGSVAAIGALGGDGLTADSGYVSLYRRGEDGWRLEGRLAASDGRTGDGFGSSLAAEGGFVVVGAGLAIRDERTTGAAYVYDVGEQ